MDDRTNEIIEPIIRQKKRLQELLEKQDKITAKLVNLERDYDAGNVTRAELDSQLEVLIPRHERLQQEIALAFADIERMRQQIFHETGLELPPMT